VESWSSSCLGFKKSVLHSQCQLRCSVASMLRRAIWRIPQEAQSAGWDKKKKWRRAPICVRGGACITAAGGADVLTLANLCVDSITAVDSLPQDDHSRAHVHASLKSSASAASWECGGASNFAIAASRLGLRSASLGHTGEDAAGEFLLKALASEGVSVSQLSSLHQRDDGYEPTAEPNTLICHVLRNTAGEHGFISRFDVNNEPLLSHLSSLSPEAMQMLHSAGALKVNGFIFDEWPAEVVERSLSAAREDASVPIMFDPGPRAPHLLNDVPSGGANAINWLLRRSDVLFLTRREAEIVSGGILDPMKAASTLLQESERKDPWIIVKLGEKGSFLLRRVHANAPLHCAGYEVDVKDQVGCGDSFAAAIALARKCKLDAHAALSLANAVGAATASSVGAGRNVASCGMVLRLLEQRTATEPDNEEREAARAALSALESSLNSSLAHL